MLKLVVDDFYVSPDGAPDWWVGVPRGAWGCMMAHRRAIQEAIDREATDVMIMEGDATPSVGVLAGSEDTYRRWLSRTPTLDALYLGGQYLSVIENPPRIAGVIPPLIFLRGGFLIRQHAYCCTWGGMRKIASIIDRCDTPGHIDMILGREISLGSLQAYGVSPWLYGQSGHASAVQDGRYAEANEWQLTESEWKFITQ